MSDIEMCDRCDGKVVMDESQVGLAYHAAARHVGDYPECLADCDEVVPKMIEVMRGIVIAEAVDGAPA